jgi:hypothetical protein
MPLDKGSQREVETSSQATPRFLLRQGSGSFDEFCRHPNPKNRLRISHQAIEGQFVAMKKRRAAPQKTFERRDSRKSEG